MKLGSVERLFGRETELARLLEALEQAHSCRGRLALLVGEPGIGKTRLAEELCERSRTSASVHWGRCWEAGGAPAFWPWVQILRSLIAELDGQNVQSALGESVADLIALVPELRDSAAGPTARARDTSAEERFRLFDSVTAFLRRAAAERALLLVLDDLHAADVPSLLLLRFVARSLTGSKILVVGAFRDVEAQLTPEARAVLAEIDCEGERLTPRRLVRPEVRALIAETYKLDPEEDLVDTVTRSTDGNPLFVHEALRLAWTGDVLQAPTSTALIRLSKSVDSAIRARLALVGAAARSVLQMGAAIGREFELELLCAATGERREALLETLGEMLRIGIVSELDDRTPRYRFSHFLVREALYRAMSPDERCRLHAAVAAGFECLQRTFAEDHVVEFAHHSLLAGSAGDPVKASSYAVRAGEQALRAFAYEEAANWLERGLAALAELAEPDLHRRLELLLSLAEARVLSGDRERARKTCQDAAALARDVGAPELVARAALTLGTEIVPQVVDSTLAELLQEALDRLTAPEHAALRLQVMARLAAALQPSSDPEVPTALARKAIAEARASADRATLAQVLHSARAAYMPLDSLEERAEIDNESLELAYETNQRGLALQARQRLVYCMLEQGELASALAHVVAYENLAEKLRRPSHRFAAKIARHNLAAMMGRFEESQRFLDEAAALITSTGDPNAAMTLKLGELHLLRAACRHERIAGLVEDIHETSSGSAIHCCTACTKRSGVLATAACRHCVASSRRCSRRHCPPG
jgi:predicted ATPase